MNNIIYAETFIHLSYESGYDYKNQWFDCRMDGWTISAFLFRDSDYENLSCEGCTISNVEFAVTQDNQLQFNPTMHKIVYSSGKYTITCQDSMAFVQPFGNGMVFV